MTVIQPDVDAVVLKVLRCRGARLYFVPMVDGDFSQALIEPVDLDPRNGRHLEL
jgi:hypothetical protein